MEKPKFADDCVFAQLLCYSFSLSKSNVFNLTKYNCDMQVFPLNGVKCKFL